MGSLNAIRRCNVTSSLIDLVHTQNDPRQGYVGYVSDKGDAWMKKYMASIKKGEFFIVTTISQNDKS